MPAAGETRRRPGVGGAALARAGRELARIGVLVLVVTSALFFLLRLTGDPSAMLAGPDASAEQLAAIRAEYGLDRPLIVQYASYLSHLVRGDFGVSLASGQPALTVVLEALPATLALALPALLLAFVCAIGLGAWLGSGTGRARRLMSGLVFILQGTPGFVAGLLLIQLFAIELAWLPSMGAYGAASYVLPVATLAMFLLPKQTRLIASSVREAYQEDYVRTAVAIGATEREVLFRHVLPNAMVGSVALLGAQTALLLSGATVTETIFGWPGAGTLLLTSAQVLDFPVIQAIAIVVALLVFLANVLADVAVAALDPRARDAAEAV